MTSKLFVIWVVLMASLVSVPAMAQTNTTTSTTDHWATFDLCNAAVSAKKATPYLPGISNPQTPDMANGDKFLYSPTGWCNNEHSKYGLSWLYYTAEQPLLQRGGKLFDPRCYNRVEESRMVILLSVSAPVPVQTPTLAPTPVVPTTQTKETETKIVAGTPVVYNYTTNITNNNPAPSSGDGNNGGSGYANNGGYYDNNRDGGEQSSQYSGGGQVVYTSLPTVYVTPSIWYGGAYWDWCVGFGYRSRYGLSHGWYPGAINGSWQSSRGFFPDGRNFDNGGPGNYGNRGGYYGGQGGGRGGYGNQGGGRGYYGQNPGNGGGRGNGWSGGGNRYGGGGQPPRAPGGWHGGSSFQGGGYRSGGNNFGGGNRGGGGFSGGRGGGGHR